VGAAARRRQFVDGERSHRRVDVAARQLASREEAKVGPRAADRAHPAAARQDLRGAAARLVEPLPLPAPPVDQCLRRLPRRCLHARVYATKRAIVTSVDDAALTAFVDARFAFACTRRVSELVDVDRLLAAVDVAAEPSRLAR